MGLTRLSVALSSAAVLISALGLAVHFEAQASRARIAAAELEADREDARIRQEALGPVLCFARPGPDGAPVAVICADRRGYPPPDAGWLRIRSAYTAYPEGRDGGRSESPVYGRPLTLCRSDGGAMDPGTPCVEDPATMRIRQPRRP